MLALLSLVVATQQPAIDPTLAGRYFRQAHELAKTDNGKLWGMTLDGPMIFADRATHQIVANMADPNGALKPQGAVYAGLLPKEINIANTSIEWSGRRWTMVAWPLPDINYTRGRLLMHESFHRIQPALGFHIPDLPSEHLDDLNGRTWMRLEMRALSEAMTETGEKRKVAAQDALLFRHRRQELCGDKAAESERQLELNEGLAEYTGYELSGLPAPAIPIRVAARLDNEQAGDSFSRSFCYLTGPSYALLLDEYSPGWRKRVVKGEPLDELLAKALRFRPKDLNAALARYDGDLVIAQETAREAAHQQRVAQYKAKFIDGPVLIMKPGNNFSFGFDPNAVDSFPGYGSVYNGARVTDDWGVLDATGDVLFIRTNGLITEIRVPIKGNSTQPPTAGDGWTLTLNNAYKLTPASRPGDWVIYKS